MNGIPKAAGAGRRRIVVWGVALLTVSVVAGCGGDGGRYDISGKVTYRGQPVPLGEVTFEPDPEHGNVGPQARATIKDGHYRTDPGKGSIGGRVLIRVTGMSHPPGTDPKDMATMFPLPLFPPYEFEYEILDGDTVVHIVVPADVE